VLTLQIKPQNFAGSVSMDIVQIEIVAECDSDSTCAELAHQPESVRSLLNSVLIPMSREELMTKRGKQNLKKIIIEALNHHTHSGSVKNVYFSSLMIM
jgi:flagellar basal body-associated protein FliL